MIHNSCVKDEAEVRAAGAHLLCIHAVRSILEARHQLALQAQGHHSYSLHIVNFVLQEFCVARSAISAAPVGFFLRLHRCHLTGMHALLAQSVDSRGYAGE